MFGEEINSFVSLDLIYDRFCDKEGYGYLNRDLFYLIRKELHRYFFGNEKNDVHSELKKDLKQRFEKIKKMENSYSSLSQRPWIMPIRLSFPDHLDLNPDFPSRSIGLITPPSPIICINRESETKYYINGVCIYPGNSVPNQWSARFSDSMHIGFGDLERKIYLDKKRRILNGGWEGSIKDICGYKDNIYGYNGDWKKGWEKMCIRDDMDEEEKSINSK
jgi:hypothetical protein